MTALFIEYPKCTTCKKAKKWLDEHGVEYIDRHIVEDNPTAEELAAWQQRSGLPLRRFFNTSGMKYRELGIKAKLDAGMSDEEAFALLKQAKDSGVYQAFVMDEVFQKMEGGNAAVAMYYAGDYLTMLENNEDLAFVVPEEGSNWFVDAMCILKSSQHMSEAEEWINFIASTDSNLANMDYIWYASPNREALEQYPAYYAEVNEEELDPEIYEIMAPPAETLDRCEIYENLPKDTLRLYDRLWTRLGV